MVIQYLIYLIVFSMPAYLVRFQVFGVPTTFLEVLIYMAFFAWLIKKRDWAREWKGWRKFFQENRLMVIASSLLFFGALLSTIFSSDPRASVGIFKAYFFDPLLFLIVLTSIFSTLASSEEREKFKKNILYSLIASGTVVAATSLFLGAETFNDRLRGLYLSPNHLAMYLSPVLLVSFYLFFKRLFYGDGFLEVRTPRGPTSEILKKSDIFSRKAGYNERGVGPRDINRTSKKPLNFKTFLLGICGILLLFAIYLTKSYGAFIGLFGALILYLFFSSISVKKRFWMILVVFLLLNVVFIAETPTEKFQNLFERRSPVQSRIVIWKSAWKIGQDNRFLGIGPGTFQEKYLEYQEYFPSYPEWAVPQPHNIFLAFWLQTGIIGFVGFLLLIYASIKTAFKNFKTDYLAGIFLLFIFYFLIHGLVDTPFWKNDLALMFWLFIGLLALVNRRQLKI